MHPGRDAFVRQGVVDKQPSGIGIRSVAQQRRALFERRSDVRNNQLDRCAGLLNEVRQAFHTDQLDSSLTSSHSFSCRHTAREDPAEVVSDRLDDVIAVVSGQGIPVTHVHVSDGEVSGKDLVLPLRVRQISERRRPIRFVDIIGVDADPPWNSQRSTIPGIRPLERLWIITPNRDEVLV